MERELGSEEAPFEMSDTGIKRKSRSKHLQSPNLKKSLVLRCGKDTYPLTVLVPYEVPTHALIQRAVVQGLERPGDAIFATVHRCALALSIYVIKQNFLHFGQLAGRNESWFQNNSPLNCLLIERELGGKEEASFEMSDISMKRKPRSALQLAKLSKHLSDLQYSTERRLTKLAAGWFCQ